MGEVLEEGGLRREDCQGYALVVIWDLSVR